MLLTRFWLVVGVFAAALGCGEDEPVAAIRPSAERLSVDLDLACEGGRPQVGLDLVAITPAAGPCFWFARSHIVVRPASQDAWNALLQSVPGLLVAVDPPVPIATDVRLLASGERVEEPTQIVARVDLDRAREVLIAAGAPAAEPPSAATASDQAARALLDLCAWLTDAHSAKVSAAGPLAVAVVGNAGGSSPQPSACVSPQGVHDARASGCAGDALTSGTGLLSVLEARLSEALDPCGADVCGAADVRLSLLLPSQWPVHCPSGQLDTCLGGGRSLPGNVRLGSGFAWVLSGSPLELRYEHWGLFSFADAPPDTVAYVVAWEDDACVGWWLLESCDPDDVLGVAPVQRGASAEGVTLHLGPLTLKLRTVECLTAEEICDGLDNDCNGAVDEADPEVGEPCGGAAALVCTLGHKACQDGHLVCEGVIPLGTEVCDGADNDCDGLTDESDASAAAPCGSQLGECAGTHGEIVCTGGVLVCDQEIPLEQCGSGADEDCDGVADEADCTDVPPGQTEVVVSCGSDVGECKSGTMTCDLTGVCGPCAGALLPAAKELCNGLDDDCDGAVDVACAWCDDGAKKPCTPPGLDDSCADTGVSVCQSGAWGPCISNQPPAEICDGLDNDCNGSVDETCDCTPADVAACGPPDVGLCKPGHRICQPEGLWGPCEGGLPPQVEVCDGADNDCDGEADEAPCVCAVGDLLQCSTDVGECEPGWQQCLNNAWSPCSGVLPVPEVCDGLDNDCDATSDEDFPCRCGDVQPCSTNVGECVEGTVTCVPTNGGAWSQWTPCTGILPAEEVCDAKDNDCDGTNDEGLAGCGLAASCMSGCYVAHDGPSTIAMSMLPGDKVTGLIMPTKVEYDVDKDWAWYLGFSPPSTFTFDEDYEGGGFNQVCYRACLLSATKTAHMSKATATFSGSPQAFFSAPWPDNPFEATRVAIGVIRTYGTNADDDYGYTATVSPSGVMTVQGLDGNSGSSVQADLLLLSLPAGYTVQQDWFETVGTTGTTKSANFTVVPTLGELWFHSVLTYDPNTDDDFDYTTLCFAGNPPQRSCTAVVNNGNSGSRVAGVVTLIQGPF